MPQKIPSFMLQEWQSLPLEKKVELSKLRIKQFYESLDGKVYVAFSGGKDSLVLLHLVRSIYPEVEGVFFDTGVEFPEIHEVVNNTENITTIHPEKRFQQIIKDDGYPVISKVISSQIERVRKYPNSAIAKYYTTGIKKNGTYKRRGKIPDKWMYLLDAPFKISWSCCHHLKKKPVSKFIKMTGKKPYIGIMASDSSQRNAQFLQTGCNSFKEGKEQSTPLGFWLESDIWDYITRYDLKYCKLYDRGWDRTGCMFCLYGIHMEKQPNRIQRLYDYNPKLYDYCIENLGVGKIMEYLKLPHKPFKTLDSY